MYRRWRLESGQFAGAHVGRGDFVRHLAAQHIAGDLSACEIIFGELVANALKYGSDPIYVIVHQYDGEVRLHVEDGGRCFEPEDAYDAADSADPDVIGGRGLQICAALALDLEIQRLSNNRCRVSATLPITVANAA